MDFPKKVLRNFPAEVAENRGGLKTAPISNSICEELSSGRYNEWRIFHLSDLT
jgi:hypothetical protein